MKKRFKLKHALVLCTRNLIKLTRTPEQLIDVTLQPIIFLVLFLYVFGGAISHGSQHDYLQFLLPGLIGQTIAMSSISIGQNMNADIAKGVFDRFRSLPIARSVPLVGAVLAAIPDIELGAHLHARPQQAAEKVAAAYQAGCYRLDMALGGFGGCPFAQDALVGNVATETAIRELSKLGAILPHLQPLDELLTMGRDIADRFGAAKL